MPKFDWAAPRSSAQSSRLQPVPGDGIVLIQIPATIRQWDVNGLPEGAYVNLGAGKSFQISYVGAPV